MPRAAADIPPPIKNPRRRALQVPIEDDSCFREGCDAGVHRSMLLAELRVVLPVIALCLLTRFRGERLLGET